MTTVAFTIQAEDGPEVVQAQPATPGLYVYEAPPTVDIGAPCRWRIGHHAGLLLAGFRTAEQAHAAAAAVADWATWTDGPDVVQQRCTGPGSDPWAMRDLIDRIEAAGGHLGHCAHPEPDPDWLPNGGHAEPCAYVGGIGSRCTCST